MNAVIDYGCYTHESAGRLSLYMQVDGMRCASCAWKIEQALSAHKGVEARVNFSTERLRISWPKSEEPGAANDNGKIANDFAREIETLGFHVAPFDPDDRLQTAKVEERALLASLSVAGFATLAVMLFVDPLWFLPEAALNGATLDLMHWVTGLIAMPATLYCGKPFFRSALSALRNGKANMDVPISLAVILANAMSLFETIRHGRHVYFDASIMLLFFLLIGRYLDLKARGKARAAAQGLLAMLEGTARILENGHIRAVRSREIRPGQILLVAAGEKIAADGRVIFGASEIDTRLVTGETLPKPVRHGDKVFAGMINQANPLQIEVSATADDSLLSEIVALMEKAEQSQSPYVRFADRVAGVYAPVVHGLALVTFLGWTLGSLFAHQPDAWEDALLKAMAVLLITCPCALGLAVPAVHVLASSELFRRGILLKSGVALEKLAQIDTVVFDKTGTLTTGTPTWLNPQALVGEDLQLAQAMSTQSQHPLSQALAAGAAPMAELSVTDFPGRGLKANYQGETLWLGNAAWLGIETEPGTSTELWFQRTRDAKMGPPVRLSFADTVRADACEVVAKLRQAGLEVWMLSGDRLCVAEALGSSIGIAAIRADLSPIDKVEILEAMRDDGRKVLMIGDGLNDAAALTTAFVSMSPSSGMDVTQNAADLVYRGEGVEPVALAVEMAARTRRLVRQNFAMSMAYNLVAIPAAIFGFVTPLIAAMAMSSSSLLVVLNSLRLKRRADKIAARQRE